MRFRALALLLAGAMAVAPSFVVACEVACATAESADSAMPAMHGCHHAEAAPTGSPGLATVHGCSHDDGELATSAEKTAPVSVMIATVPLAVVLAIPQVTPLGAVSDSARARPPDRTPRAPQLRI